MGTGDHNAGGGGGLPCDGLASHPGGSSNIPSRFMLQKPDLSAGMMGHLARMQTSPFFLPLIFSRYTHEPLGEYVYLKNASDKKIQKLKHF